MTANKHQNYAELAAKDSEFLCIFTATDTMK